MATFEVATDEVAVNYTLAVGPTFEVATDEVAVNYTGASAGIHHFKNGIVVQPGLFRYKNGVVTDMSPHIPPTLTWPRSFGAFGTYMPDEGNTGLPDEYKSQLEVVEGNYTVNSVADVLDMKEIRGNLVFNVPYLNVDPDRLWVRGRTDYTTSTGLVQFMHPNPTKQIILKNTTIEPLVTSEWTRGIEGWWFMAEMCKIIHCQDGIMARTNAATGVSNAGDRGTLIDWLTYFRVLVGRATSLQTHNDCVQFNGANGYSSLGSMYNARYGNRGQFQPNIIENVAQTTGANNDHPETACLQCNVSGDGVKTANLNYRNTWLFGGYYPINYGDPGMDGTTANPWVIGDIVNCWADSAMKHGSPPIWINGRDAQAFYYSGNKWYDGPNVGQSPLYRGGIQPSGPVFADGPLVYPSGTTYPSSNTFPNGA